VEPDDGQWYSALHYLCAAVHANFEAVHDLLSSGADSAAPSEMALTVLGITLLSYQNFEARFVIRDVPRNKSEPVGRRRAKRGLYHRKTA